MLRDYEHKLGVCDLLTVQQVADKLELSERTVYKYIKEKRIKAVRIGRLWRISLDAYFSFVFNETAEKLQKNHERIVELRQQFFGKL
jgi:excisionase family DNA binding protein